MKPVPNLNELSSGQLRTLEQQLLREVQEKDELPANKDELITSSERVNAKSKSIIQHIELENSKLKHEMAILKHHKLARTCEALNPQQRSLLDDLINEDIAGIEEQLAQHDQLLQSEPKPKQTPRRASQPPELPRTLIQHDPDNTQCKLWLAVTTHR